MNTPANEYPRVETAKNSCAAVTDFLGFSYAVMTRLDISLISTKIITVRPIWLTGQAPRALLHCCSYSLKYAADKFKAQFGTNYADLNITEGFRMPARLQREVIFIVGATYSENVDYAALFKKIMED